MSKVSGKNIDLHVIMVRKLAWHRRITQHKRFVSDGTNPNFCFARTSFMLIPLSKIVGLINRW